MVVSELAKSKCKAPKSSFFSKTLIASVLACVISSGVSTPSYAVELMDAYVQYSQATEEWCYNNGFHFSKDNFVFNADVNDNIRNYFKEKYNDPDVEVNLNYMFFDDNNNVCFGGSLYSRNRTKYKSDSMTGGYSGEFIISFDELMEMGSAKGLFANAYSNQYLSNYSSVNHGVRALAKGNNSVALGTDAVVNEDSSNSVALGSGSIANTPNVISVGNDDLRRRIVNVANGVADSDVATVGQLNRAIKNSVDISNMGTGNSVEKINNPIVIGRNNTVNNTYQGAQIAGDYEGSVLIGNNISATPENGTGRYGSNDLFEIINNSDGTVNVPKKFEKVAYAVGIGDGVKIGDMDTVAIGSNAKATSKSATAVGHGADASSERSVALGMSAKASGLMSSALGWGANASDLGTTAIGTKSKAKGDFDVAVGYDSTISSTKGYNTAIGYKSTIKESSTQDAIALGSRSNVSKSNAVAIGTYSNVQGNNGVALGQRSLVKSNSSVAIGSNSVASDDNVVSFGRGINDPLLTESQINYRYSRDGDELVLTEEEVVIANQMIGTPEEYKRRLIHVADGINDSDVATVGQLNAAIADISSSGNIIGSNNTVSDVSDVVIHGDNNTVSNPASFYGYTDGNVADGVLKNVVLIGNNSSASVTNVSSPRATRNIYSDSIGIGIDSDGNMSQVPIEYNRIENVVGIGNDVKIADSDTVAIGHSAKALGHYGTAIGGYSEASYEGGVAVGYAAKSSSLNTTALGLSAKAESSYATALGSVTSAMNQATAIGYGSKATARGDLVAGYTARTTTNSENSVVLGSSASGSNKNVVATGYLSKANGLNSVALGSGATANNTASIAVGSDSIAKEDNVVSFGHDAGDKHIIIEEYHEAGYTGYLTDEVSYDSDLNRRLTHIADGINDNDAATVGQINALLQGSTGSYNNTNYVGINSTGGSNVNGEEAIGADAVAIGKDAAGVNRDTTAVGSHAWAVASGSVALGADSIATSSDEVSVGHQGGSYEYMNGNVGHGSSYGASDGGDGSLYRRVTNVKDGVGDHDAVTVGQMNHVVADFATSDSLDTKANIDLDNISDNGVNVVSAIAQRSTKVIAGQNTNVTVGDNNGTVTYAVNVATNGAIAEGNEGIVTGGAIYDALQNVSANTGEITPYTAGDGIAISNTKQISVVKDGEVEHGNTGLVTGGQVYDKLSAYNENLTDILDGVVSNIENDLDTKAKRNLSNLDNSGKNVIRSLVQNSIQLNAGQNTNLTVTASDGKLNYTIDTVATGEVANNNIGLMSGGAVYNEVRPTNGNYIANNKTVAENLTVLDTSIKNVSDRVDVLGGTIADTTVVRYDSNTKDKLTLNGTQGTTLTNLKNGAVTASSTDAVTGSQLYSVKRSVDDHTTAINTLQGNITENANAISSLDGRVTSMEDMVTHAFNATEELQTTVGGLETTVGNMQTTVNEMQDTVSGLTTDVNNVKSAVTDLEGDFTTIQENVSDLQNGLGSVQNDVSDVKETLETVQADTTQIKENVTSLQSNVDTLQQDLETKANADGSNIDVAKFIEKMKAEENGIVMKDDLHAETRVEEDGNFVKKINSLQDNLLALDNGMSDLRNSIPKETHGMSVNFKNTNDANYNGSGAIGDNALAVGPNAEASGEDAIAIGHGSKASGLQSIAVGTGNEVSGNHSGAFGDPNDVSGDNSYVIGNDNTVSGDNTFVLGNNVTNATGSNSVVLGANSDGSQDNVVSVGKEGAERKIIHVAEGSIEKDSTDAVTGGQLYDVKEDFRNAQGIDTDKWANALGTGTVSEGDSDLVTGGTVYDAIKDLQIVKDIVVPDFSSGNIQIAGSPAYDMIDTINVSKSDGSGRVITGVVANPEDVTSVANVGYVNAVGQTIVNGVNNVIHEVDIKANKIGASAAAIASLEAPPMDGDEKWAFSASVGHYRGETAGAVGAYYRPQDNIMLNVKGAVGNGEDMIGGGVGIALQRGNSAGLTKASLAKAVNSQARVIEEMKAEREADKAEIAELKAMVQQLTERQEQTEQRNAQ